VRLLLDSHYIVAIVDLKLRERFPAFSRLLVAENPELLVSIASIWELSIKSRLKKIDLRVPPRQLPSILDDFGIGLLPIAPEHATADIHPDVPTRDPFDRLLVAQAQLEGLRLVTADRSLVDHPVTFR
jgi:PIN domain nuclease of toxin-antitoxin system